MSDRIEAEILDALGEEVDAAIDTPIVVIEGTKGEPGADGITPTIGPNGNWFLGATDTGKPSRGATGAPGKGGADGKPGAAGAPGKDGHSPVVTATKSGKATTISVDGTAIATVEDGADGKPGAAGAPGKNGSDATVTAASIKGALGYTPAAPGDIPVVPTAEISANTGARHSHANKAVIDGITAARAAAWDAKVSPAALGPAVNTALQAAKDSGAFRGDKGDPGDKGEPGAPGKTPVRGTDYWTAADKQEIVNSVIAALPDGTEVSY